MKKWLFLSLALCLLLPSAASAQGLAELWTTVGSSVSEGIQFGAQQAAASMEKELTLELALSQPRIETGESVTLTVLAGNPRMQATPVSITLDLPERLAIDGEATWEALLPAAKYDPETGETQPQMVEFTHTLTLARGSESETTAIHAEMAMGTRFYKAETVLEICMPDIRATGAVIGGNQYRVEQGEAYQYQANLVNAGRAGGEAKVELTLPVGVEPDGALPEGFVYAKQVVSGSVFVPAAEGETNGEVSVTIPVRAKEDALDGDDDALRLLVAGLRVNGRSVAVPRMQLCGAKITAKLSTEQERLHAGQETEMTITVVNSGLAAADVRVSCVLPEGMKLAEEQEDEEKPKAILPEEDGDSGLGEALPTQEAMTEQGRASAAEAAMHEEQNALIYDLHMDGATQRGGGILPSTKTLTIRVVAEEPVEDMKEKLVGASLAWRVADEETQLGEPVVLRISEPTFLGLNGEQWSGVFWATLLLVSTLLCLYLAMRAEDRDNEEYVCE